MMRTGVVLCGGRSSRMGRAKAWLSWAGRPMLAHVVEAIRDAVDEVVVVAAPDQALPDVDARVVSDDEEGLGPLAGIARGLAEARGELAFVTATDAPFLTTAFVAAVLAPGRAAAPVVDDFVQALSAAYPTAAAGLAADLLAKGHRRPRDLLEALDFVALDPDDLPDLESVRGFNSPEQYLAAVAGTDPAPAVLELTGRARSIVGEPAMEVPCGSLADVLGAVAGALELRDGGRLARPYAVSLGGRDFVRDLSVPIGPGEHVIVLDATVGG